MFDAFMTPAILAGNTNTPTTMIAENIVRMMPGQDLRKHDRPA